MNEKVIEETEQVINEVIKEIIIEEAISINEDAENFEEVE